MIIICRGEKERGREGEKRETEREDRSSVPRSITSACWAAGAAVLAGADLSELGL